MHILWKIELTHLRKINTRGSRRRRKDRVCSARKSKGRKSHLWPECAEWSLTCSSANYSTALSHLLWTKTPTTQRNGWACLDCSFQPFSSPFFVFQHTVKAVKPARSGPETKPASKNTSALKQSQPLWWSSFCYSEKFRKQCFFSNPNMKLYFNTNMMIPTDLLAESLSYITEGSVLRLQFIFSLLVTQWLNFQMLFMLFL